ncbi:prepilin-type N-terminal cleavage/methylation domain-containing protein [Lysobacter sp. KIS68-7]|uniref:type IV pilin protein n=1 Tax=Lysobacter sp. KIS68-7 TaxID=2904252 RepID=UPI001E475C85|nr:type IV pilin protein [Lysobacter sp. KIS68-7]UHQ19274.1 prepilin-type N-terminal cleavage/methylation domain-containing protein [Lysobacter sp. KIS68-7]
MHAYRNKKRTEAGFTLLELMIVVMIVAILAALAISGYDFATRKSRRAAAKSCLTEAAGALERFYTVNQTYVGAAYTCSGDVNQYYTVSYTLAAGTFTATATPQGKQAKDTCGTLSLDNTMLKTPAGNDCW